jgi:SAM-dependent methyltransferase
MTAKHPANRQQAEAWNSASGPVWVEMQAILDRMLAPFETLLTDAAFPGPGRQVLDIGCGAGATTLAMARRLGAEGLALGVDISEPLVAAARGRAEAEGLRSAAFVLADAQTYDFDPGAFDAAVSRFGVMFFDDPEAAFANIRRALVPGGRLAFVAWRSPAENPFMTTAARAVAPFVPPAPPPAPDAPGQFGFADGARVARILAAAGWRDIVVQPIDVPTEMPEVDLKAYVTRMGPAGAALREADPATRARAQGALEDAFRSFVSGGAARFICACWQVTARA